MNPLDSNSPWKFDADVNYFRDGDSRTLYFERASDRKRAVRDVDFTVNESAGTFVALTELIPVTRETNTKPSYDLKKDFPPSHTPFKRSRMEHGLLVEWPMGLGDMAGTLVAPLNSSLPFEMPTTNFQKKLLASEKRALHEQVVATFRQTGKTYTTTAMAKALFKRLEYIQQFNTAVIGRHGAIDVFFPNPLAISLFLIKRIVWPNKLPRAVLPEDREFFLGMVKFYTEVDYGQ